MLRVIEDLCRPAALDDLAAVEHVSVLAIADRLIEEAMDGLPAHDCWVETVIDSTRRLRRTYLANPAAASLSSFRTTGRPAEMRVVDRTLEAVMAAGYEGLEAAVVYRAVGQEEYPHIWRVRDELPLVADDDIFEAVLAIVITGICERAPQPCTCGAHPGGAAAMKP